MRRITTAFFSFLVLAACSEATESPVSQGTHGIETSLPASSAGDIFDGTSGAPGANPHFFFFNPVAENTPNYSGIADDSLEPVVTVCPMGAWNTATEECTPGQETAVFSADASDPDDQVQLDSGTKYHVVWRTNDHPAQAGESYRIAVSVVGNVLGYADVTAFDNVTFSGHHNTQDGVIAISDNASLNIAFRIEEGALEAEYCDAGNLEDCDVALFTYEEAGCLRVFENPGQTGEELGSQACVPANAATLNDAPVQGTYAVILTLEEQNQVQGGDVPIDQQIPYFPDLYTDPPGITFDANSTGIQVALCQVDEGPDAIDEALHPFLRPFIVFADGTTVLPEDYSYGVAECEGYAAHAHSVASADGERGILARLATGAVKVGKFFLPQPLVARRLHGGLNTTVYNTRGNDSDGEGGAENVAPVLATGPQPEIAEFGAVLDVDPLNSEATVPGTGQVGVETTITILALDPQGLPFPFEVPVFLEATSGQDLIEGTVTYDGTGTYTATYTPTSVGTDAITITIDGGEMAGSPFAMEIAPRSVDASGSSFEVSYSEAGSPTTVTVTVNDTQGDPYTYGEDFPVTVSIGVTGANTATATATDDDGNGNYDGTYVATYSPENYGNDVITVTVNGDPTGDSPFTVTTAPQPVDPNQSSATVQSSANVSGGLVDSQTDISITVLNAAGDLYDYADIRPIDVQFAVSGANTVPSTAASDPEGDGTYSAAYTPTNAGTDLVTVTIDGTSIAGSPFTSVVAPLSGDLVVDVSISGGAPEDGLPVILYQGSNPTPFMTGTTDGNGQVTFVDIDFGSYTAHLPKRDFDVAFNSMTIAFDHNEAPEFVTFNGTTQSIPAETKVWRVRDGGNGNAYQYMVGTRSWTSAMNQVRDDVLLGVDGHLATIHSQAENDFVANFYVTSPDLCPNETNPKRCKYKGWLGLNDEDTEGTFQWVTGEAVTFYSWADGGTAADQPLDRKGNMDHVEIDMTGTWDIINGASSTNEGYFVEWDVIWPTFGYPGG
jgi:hypothetical protein